MKHIVTTTDRITFWSDGSVSEWISRSNGNTVERIIPAPTPSSPLPPPPILPRIELTPRDFVSSGDTKPAH